MRDELLKVTLFMSLTLVTAPQSKQYYTKEEIAAIKSGESLQLI